MAPKREKKDVDHQERKSGNGERRQRRAAMADSATQEDQCHPRKIFIGGLSSNTTTQDLRVYFSRFGAIADAVVLQWPDGRSRGFGYVTYADASASMAALKTQHVVGGRPVDVKRAVPGTNKLFVGGLPQNASAAELRGHFESYGVVSDAVVMIDPATGRSRGFGFVCFCPGQEGSAALAMALDQYQNHRIRGKWIEVKSAAPPHKLGSQEQPDALAPEAAAMASMFPPPMMGAAPWACAASEEALAMQAANMLPRLLCHGEPQKVPLPGVAADNKAPDATIGAPPGLDVMLTPRMAFDPTGGPIPWPSAHAAAALPPAPWMGSFPPDFGEKMAGAPYMARPGDGMGSHGGWDPLAAVAALDPRGAPEASEGLQRSLEQLLRLRLGPSDEEAAAA